MKRFLTCAVAGVALGTASMAQAVTIDVLWYGYSEFSGYNDTITTLADGAGTYDPDGDGALDWNLDIWEEGEAAPDFTSYDVFVIGSVGIAPANDTRLLAAGSDITAARGTRTFISGQDADWHLHNNIGFVDDGPRGFLVNAVNWAASGTDLGIVTLPDNGSSWFDETGSFLKDELEGNFAYFNEEDVIIPDDTSDFPVNEGLTTAGLSNWATSSHQGFTKGLEGYKSINDTGASFYEDDYVITLVTEEFADDDTGGGDDDDPTPDPEVIPEPTTALLGMMAMGAAGLAGLRRRVR